MNALIKKSINNQGLFKELIRYTLPLVAANLLQSFYSLTDFLLTGMFVGDAGLSAVSNGSQVMVLYTGIIIGLSNGGNVMIGQYTGAGRKKECSACTGTFLTLFLGIGVLSALGLWYYADPIVTMMKAPVRDMSAAYLLYCAPGALAIAGYNAAAATLRGVGDSKRPLFCVTASVALNIFLDWLLMGPLEMGVVGAAIATAVSQYVSFGAALLCLGFGKEDRLLPERSDFFPRRNHVSSIMKIGFPCAVQMTVASVSWLSVTVLLNRYGMIVSAAYGASARIKDVVQTVTAAISMAATAMIAQALGAGKHDKALKIMYLAMYLAVGFAAVNILLAEVFAPTLVGLFSDGPEMISAGVENLRIEIIGQLFYAVFMIYHSMMTGAGHTKMVLFSSFVNCILVRAVLAGALSSIPVLGATGVYLACMIAPASSIPIGAAYIRRGRWRKTLV
ncbi:MAG: MATE family efflux transporter [Lachnospiraceae bacterium]|nr:MATE family efflux transporter [Lachnospiraceae bacterium]